MAKFPPSAQKDRGKKDGLHNCAAVNRGDFGDEAGNAHPCNKRRKYGKANDCQAKKRKAIRGVIKPRAGFVEGSRRRMDGDGSEKKDAQTGLGSQYDLPRPLNIHDRINHVKGMPGR